MCKPYTVYWPQHRLCRQQPAPLLRALVHGTHESEGQLAQTFVKPTQLLQHLTSLWRRRSCLAVGLVGPGHSVPRRGAGGRPGACLPLAESDFRRGKQRPDGSARKRRLANSKEFHGACHSEPQEVLVGWWCVGGARPAVCCSPDAAGADCTLDGSHSRRIALKARAVKNAAVAEHGVTVV